MIQQSFHFPKEGNGGGDKRYRGNCSGWIQAFLVWKYKVKKFAELFVGSGTGSDVARDMGINYVGGKEARNDKS